MGGPRGGAGFRRLNRGRFFGLRRTTGLPINFPISTHRGERDPPWRQWPDPLITRCAPGDGPPKRSGGKPAPGAESMCPFSIEKVPGANSIFYPIK